VNQILQGLTNMHVMPSSPTPHSGTFTYVQHLLISDFFFFCFFLKLWLRLPLEKSEPTDDDLDKVKDNGQTVFFISSRVAWNVM
jgi:hypothetical protein